MLTLLNCRLFWLMVGAVSTAPQAKGTFLPYQHSCNQQRCLNCSSRTKRTRMSLSSGPPILPKPPQFITATKTLDLGSHILWIICFPAYEEMEKFLKILTVF